jgi:hypothetical protein
MWQMCDSRWMVKELAIRQRLDPQRIVQTAKEVLLVLG